MAIYSEKIKEQSEKTTETVGYILEVETGLVLLAENLTDHQYNEIKDVPTEDLISQSSIPGLIYLSYSLAGSFEKGDKVSVVLSGGIAESYPVQAKASLIKNSKPLTQTRANKPIQKFQRVIKYGRTNL